MIGCSAPHEIKQHSYRACILVYLGLTDLGKISRALMKAYTIVTRPRRRSEERPDSHTGGSRHGTTWQWRGCQVKASVEQRGFGRASPEPNSSGLLPFIPRSNSTDVCRDIVITFEVYLIVTAMLRHWRKPNDQRSGWTQSALYHHLEAT